MSWIDDLLGIFWQQDGVDVKLRRTANLIGALVEDNSAEQRVDIYTNAGSYDWQTSVRLASAVLLPAATYNAVTKRLTATAFGALSVDGVAVVIDERLLVNHAADGGGARDDWNGVYIVIATGSVADPFVLERAMFCNETDQVTNGLTVYVGEGIVNGKTLWSLATADPITLEVTPIKWEQVGGAGWTGLPPGAHNGQPLTWDTGGPNWAAGLFVAAGATAASSGYLRLRPADSIGWASTLTPGKSVSIAVDATDTMHLGYTPGVPYVYPDHIAASALTDIILSAGGTAQLTLDSLSTSVDGFLEVGAGGLVATTGTIRLPTNTDLVARRGAGNVTLMSTTALPNTVSLGEPGGGATSPAGVALGSTTLGGIYTAGAATLEWDTTIVRCYEDLRIQHVAAAAERIQFGDTATSMTLETALRTGAAAVGSETLIAGQSVDSAGGAAATGGNTLVRGAMGTQAIDNGGHLRIVGGWNLAGGAGIFGNIALQTTTWPVWQAMEHGIFVGNCRNAPTGNPVGGGYLYVVAGALTWRGSGGTVSVMGPAEPHCPKCGRDCAHSWRNDDAGWELEVCMWCLTEALGDAGVIRKMQR